MNSTGAWGGTLPISSNSWVFTSANASLSASLTNDFATNFNVGGITYNSGSLAYTISGNTLNLSGNIINNSTNTQILNTAFVFQTNLTLSASAGSLTFGGIISGTNALTLSGINTKTITLSASNNYTGGTTLNSGVNVSVGSAYSFGTGTITLNGAAVTTTAAISGNIINVSAGTSNSIIGNFNFGTGIANGTVLLGSGTLTIGNGSGSTGTISGTGTSTAGNFTGTLNIGGSGVQGLATVTIPFGTLMITTGTQVWSGTTTSPINVGALTGTGGVGVKSATTVNWIIGSNNVNATYGGIMAAGSVASMTKYGTGTQTFTGANSFTGTVTINAGAIQLGNGGASGSLASASIIDNANLSLNRSDAFTFTNVISGTGTVTQVGIGTVTLTGVNTYMGATIINNGTLAFGGTSNLGTGGITLNGGTALYTNTVDFGGANGDAASAWTPTLTVGSNGGSLAMASNQVWQFNNIGMIQGGGTLTLANNGTFVINASNTGFTGSLVATNARVELEVANAIASTNIIVKGGGELALDVNSITPITLGGGTLSPNNGPITASGAISITSASTVALRNWYATSTGQNLTLSGPITGSGGLNITAPSASSTLTLNGTNTYSGATTLTSATLQLASGASIASTLTVGSGGVLIGSGSASAVTLNSGSVINAGIGVAAATLKLSSLLINGGSTYNWDLFGATNDLLSVNGNVTFSNTVGLPFNIVIQTNGSTVWSQTNSTNYTILTAGGFSNFNSAAFHLTGIGSGVWTLATNGSSLKLLYTAPGAPIQLTAASGTTLLQSSATNTSFTGVATPLFMTGVGQYVLNITNTYGGNTTIASGTLTAANASSFGTSQTIYLGTSTNGGSNATVNINTAGVIVTNTIFATGAGTNMIANSSGGSVSYSGTLDLTTNVTLANLNGGSLTYSGSVLGLGGLSVSAGSGTVSLTGNSSYNGNLMVSGGKLLLAGSNNYLGNTIIQSGELDFASSTALPATTSLTVGGAGTLNLAGFNGTVVTLSDAGSGALITNSAGASTLTLNGAGFSSYAGRITGNISLFQSGNGTLLLGGSNSYSGQTFLNAGDIALGNTNALGSGTISFNGGTLQYLLSGIKDYSGQFSSNAGQRYNVDLAGMTESWVSSLNSTNGSLTVNDSVGNGTLTLSGNNAYTGGTTLLGGSLAFSANNNLGSGTVSLNGGMLSDVGINGSTLTNNHTILIGANGGTINIAKGTNAPTQFWLSTANSLQGLGTLNVTGPGSFLSNLRISATNSFNGAISIVGASLEFGIANAVTPSSSITVGIGGELAQNVNIANALTLDGGTLSPNALNPNYTGPVFITTNGGTVALRQWYNNAAQPLTISGGISGDGALTASGVSTLTITGSGNNSYAGGTLITNSATLLLSGGDEILPSTGTVTLASGSKLDLGGNSQTVGGLAGNGSVINTNAASYFAVNVPDGTNTVFAGVISGSGLFYTAGVGTLTLTGSNSYTGGSTLAGGTVFLTNGGTLGASGQSLLIDGSTLDLGGGTLTTADFTQNSGTLQNGTLNATSYTVGSGVIGASLAGSAGLAQNGGGVTILSGSNTFTGPTSINAGILQIDGSLLGSGTVTVNSGGTIAGGGTMGTVIINDNGLIAPSAAATPAILTLASLSLSSNALATLQVNASTTAGTDYDQIAFKGGTLAYGGTLNLNNNNLFGNFTNAFSIQLFKGFTSESGDFSGVTLTGFVLSGTTNLTSANNGVWYGYNPLTGYTYSFTDVTGIFSGTTNVWSIGTGNLSQLGLTNNGMPIIFDGVPSGSVNNDVATNFSGISYANTLSGTYTLTGNNLTLGAGGLVNNSSNAQTIGIAVSLATNETFTAGAGSLVISGNVTNKGFTLTLNGTANSSVSGVISGTGGLIKTGTGTTTLSASNTYTGATTLNAGTFNVTGTDTKSVISVNGGVLAGSGSLTNVIVNSGGTLAPGAVSGPAIPTTMTAASVMLNSNSVTILDITGNAAGQNDRLNTGVTINGGVLTLIFGGTFNAGNSANWTLWTSTASLLNDFNSVTSQGLAATWTKSQSGGIWTGTGLAGVLTFTESNGALAFAAAVPEPSSYALLALGLGMVLVTFRNRKQLRCPD